MGLMENGFKVGTGLTLGLGVILLAPVVGPVIAGIGRPLAKAAIKSGLMLYQRGLEAAAEVREMMEDMAAEARSELSTEQEAAGLSITPQEGLSTDAS